MRPAIFAGLAGIVLVSLFSLTGCKRNKPPSRTRVWLGPSHACSLQQSGALECWGANDAGQLGDGTTASRGLPALVVDRDTRDTRDTPSELALGARHTCALYVGKAIKCWGDGSRGQLGAGLTTALLAPTLPVSWGGAVIVDATAIAAGGDRTCALTPDGARCWGDGKPDAIEPAGWHGAAALLAVGVGHACAAFIDPRVVRCTGDDEHGQSANRQPILPGATVVSLTAGSKHACVVLADGSVQCWGANQYGQLGDGTTADSRVPALVSGLPPATSIRAGSNHTCALLRTGTVACWGDNRMYQLANGTTDASPKPLPLPGLVGVRELAVGGDSACVRLGDGGVRCWGSNASGQLGDGTTTPHDVPMPVKAARLTPPPRPSGTPAPALSK